MDYITTLDRLKIKEKAIVLKIMLKGPVSRRLMDIGLVKGTKVECVGISPMGDPSAFLIRGAVMALRREDSAKIMIKIPAGDI